MTALFCPGKREKSSNKMSEKCHPMMQNDGMEIMTGEHIRQGKTQTNVPSGNVFAWSKGTRDGNFPKVEGNEIRGCHFVDVKNLFHHFVGRIDSNTGCRYFPLSIKLPCLNVG
jgi:hypothetical protein